MAVLHQAAYCTVAAVTTKRRKKRNEKRKRVRTGDPGPPGAGELRGWLRTCHPRHGLSTGDKPN